MTAVAMPPLVPEETSCPTGDLSGKLQKEARIVLAVDEDLGAQPFYVPGGTIVSPPPISELLGYEVIVVERYNPKWCTRIDGVRECFEY